MPGAYYRHTTSTASSTAASSAHIAHRAGSSRDHAPSWSTSSNEGLGANPMGFTTPEDDLPAMTSTTASLLDDTNEKQKEQGWTFLPRRVRPFSLRKFLVFLCLVFVLFGSAWMIRRDQAKRIAREATTIDMYLPPVAQLSRPEGAMRTDPVQWLRHNTIVDMEEITEKHRQSLIETRPKAAFIALVRNSEVEEMVYSMIQLEARFNSRVTHRYDWVFFNDEDFSEEFTFAVSSATTSRCYFEIIPKEHWSVPSWIDTTRFDVGRQFMGSIGVGKAWLQSYHHMCRWNAGLFALEKRLAHYEFFWRVEPGVDFSCNINYDVFRFMRDNNMAYGFNMAILDDARSFPSLWDRTKTFIKNNGDMIHENADYDWLLHDPLQVDGAQHTPQPFNTVENSDDIDRLEYNNCQFYSNFEVGSLAFFRSEEHRAYFEHLDKTGGFYYERFGDAPIHTLSVSLFLPKSRIWYFRDIGYAHGLCEQCPPHQFRLTVDTEVQLHIHARAIIRNDSFSEKHRRWEALSQDLIRQGGIPGLSCGCTVSAIDHNNAKLVPFESKQHKPEHACIRLYLGGKWLEKRADWDQEAEIDAGRDGSGGYLLDGLESNPFITSDSSAPK
ncbi:putative alpha- -mannosyltransferase protein [Rosellinia necatrix]|uniref:Putative alpha--mannosyltransferase protein n=1 Tax=Rosellinia necatrix TaxID=77044 RepID=A0A1W2TM71_ROSNE|nr:putative alpha- -mannosyltransferase protein [Rosellinia necatrix]